MAKKLSSGPTLKSILKKYLNEDCSFLKETKKLDPQLYEYRFNVKYPKVKDKDGNILGNLVSILKPKNKNYIEIASRIHLLEDSLNLYNEIDDATKDRIIWDIGTFLINHNLIASIYRKNLNIRFMDKLYFVDSDFPHINDLYHSIIKVTNSSMIIIEILNRNLGIISNNKVNSEGKDSYFQ